MKDILIWFFGVVAAGLIGVVLTVLFQDAIKGFLIELLRRISGPPKRGIDGRWVATFSIMRDGKVMEYVEVIEITQRFGLVKGRIVEDDRNYPELRTTASHHPLRLQGTISESFYLTGVWFHPLQTHRFMGSFQLVLSPTGNTMSGIWVGFSETLNRIDSGEWRFVRAIDD